MKPLPPFAIALFVVAAATAADWPTYRADAQRSGYTSEQLPRELSPAWRYRSLHGPSPAWPRDDRMMFDRVFDVTVSGSLAFFGSSEDGRVVALDTATGRERWSFFTDGPVRFAPTVWKDRVFAASDDGYLYALSAADGRLLDRWRCGPVDEMILGNGRMVSRWPVRGAPVVYEDTVYFASGVWQSGGIFIRALDAATGKEVWRNDEAGRIYMPQPHGGANAESGVSPQGYFVATEETLLVPTGRAVPAGFSRRTGEFKYYQLQANGRAGGTLAVAMGDSFYNSGNAYDVKTGDLRAKLGAGTVATMPGGLVNGTATGVKVVRLAGTEEPDRKGKMVKRVAHQIDWTADKINGSSAVIVAGNSIFAGGGTTVTAIDTESRQKVWSAQVDGAPLGLAVAGGRLFVSTDRGTIYAFDGGKHESPSVVQETPQAAVVDDFFHKAADEIINQTGVKDGYCLDLDCGDGSLALVLAAKTNLQIYAISPSADDVARVRKRVSEAGLYGVRITVHQGDPKAPRYGKYFADLVVSSRSLREGLVAATAENPPAVLRPYGGQLCTGQPGAMRVVTRGALANTGSWTHQYSDLGNTSCSTDDVVKGPLRALWFRDVDLELPQRHGRGPAPLFYEGRMFAEGLNELRAVNAYNGRTLWTFALPNVLTAYSQDHLSGTAITGSNFCVAGKHVFVHDKKNCYKLDAATGAKVAVFPAPPQADGTPGVWGYIACDGETLFGSLARPEVKVRFGWKPADMSELFSESSAFFAIDPANGNLRWRYDAQQSIRHNAIAIGSGRAYLIDRPIAESDTWNPRADAKAKPPAIKQPLGRLVAIDIKTGKTAWTNDQDIFGTLLAYQADQDALLMSYQSTRFKLPSEVGGRLAMHRGATGERVWAKDATYITRPLINGDTIYAQGGSWNLATGADRPFEFKRSYGCGQLAGSKHMLLYRSATLGYLDLTRGYPEDFGGVRPGCWINALPVGGLVLLPDASAGCSCSYQNRSWMGLEGNW